MLLITFVIYGLIRNMPGTPLTVDMAELDPSKTMSQERLDELAAAYGLDQPWPTAYVQWLGNVCQGDLGRSFSRKKPVIAMIMERILPTLMLSVPSLLLTFFLSIPIGIFSGARSGKTDERVLSTILYMLYSFPGFVAALFLQLYLAVEFEIFPLFGMVSDNHEQMSSLQKFQDLLWHAFLPITVYTYGSLAYYSRFVRANLQEVLRQDYIRTAQSKGLSSVRVLWHHAFRNTLIPLVTLAGLTLPSLLSGSVIIEQIFTWPGMGRLFFESITERDYPTVMGLTLVFAVLTLSAQLLADVLYAVVDPRIRLDSKS